MKKVQILDLLKEDFYEVWEENLLWEKLNNKNVLVTGASGLIGSKTVIFLMPRDRSHN